MTLPAENEMMQEDVRLMTANVIRMTVYFAWILGESPAIVLRLRELLPSMGPVLCHGV